MTLAVTATIESVQDTSDVVRTVEVSAAHTITVGGFFPCDATSGAFAITLPAAGAQTYSRRVTIKKTDVSANAVTVTRAGSDTLDGATAYALSSQYDSVTLIDDNNGNWHIVSTV